MSKKFPLSGNSRSPTWLFPPQLVLELPEVLPAEKKQKNKQKNPKTKHIPYTKLLLLGTAAQAARSWHPSIINELVLLDLVLLELTPS